MKSFEELFCEAHRCSPDEFRKKVFWRSLPWWAKLLALFVGGYGGAHFGPDREFIAGVGRASDMAHVRMEIREYFDDPLNRGWLRQVANVRASTRKVRKLARRYLPDSSTALLSPKEAAGSDAPFAEPKQKPPDRVQT